MIRNFKINNSLKQFINLNNSLHYNYKFNNFSTTKTTTIAKGGTPSSTRSFLLSKQQPFKTLNNEILPLSLSRFAIDADNYTQYESEHKAVLIKSIKNGCNVIKSSNETKIICDTISDLLDKGEINRQELIYIKKTKPFLNIDELSIKNINNQIKIALDDLYLDTIDILLLDLNNLSSSNNNNNNNNNKDEIIKKLKNEIFPHLEFLIENGNIQSYGISSNELIYGENGQLPINDIITNSDEFPHLLFFEYPFNLYENNALLSKNLNGGEKSLTQFLKENNLTSLNSSPISFDSDNGRFEMVPNHHGEIIENSLKESFNIAIHMETVNPIFNDSLQQKAIEKDKHLIGSLQWAHILVYEQTNSTLNNLWKWRKILATKIQPKVTEAILSVYGNHILNSWGGNYRKAINQLFDIYTKSLEFQTFNKQLSLNNLFNKFINEDQYQQPQQPQQPQQTNEKGQLSMDQKSLILSSIGSDILFESPNTLNQLKSLQTDIKLPTISNNDEENFKNNILPSFTNLSNNIIKFINDNKK
ncbi:hypothetical protein DDB_G0274401 [Dictyostelium discoideum AX4]|uniref:NADP-dependent oxidoreductase domain-containing protein n=1 Tax=Dictyostelium discoideum TaxID=44689 RepID=Q86KA4_DICDI|nr:hypothetical protein DDB_G0274401 [Dictyostelium discoideum AX4]EAL70093.1 hypothetical protein DDB_G0274401 [Dictyostelium discoideum AX4]|eukprot:XP_644225.1 hypothetical protein DDB_G0274401 [Dictyostelium discoideum AX4]